MAAAAAIIISIHALREESDEINQSAEQITLISIHALREESDALKAMRVVVYVEFLSTLSVRRATVHSGKSRGAPLDFYPRSP